MIIHVAQSSLTALACYTPVNSVHLSDSMGEGEGVAPPPPNTLSMANGQNSQLHSSCTQQANAIKLEIIIISVHHTVHFR